MTYTANIKTGTCSKATMLSAACFFMLALPLAASAQDLPARFACIDTSYAHTYVSIFDCQVPLCGCTRPCGPDSLYSSYNFADFCCASSCGCVVPSRKMIFALKTNLLYHILSGPSIEVEVPIADRYSVMVEDVYPWWHVGNKYCLQMWEIGPEFRYWFTPWDPQGVDKLVGFFAGVYAMTSKYDFQYDTKLDYQGEYWSAGVSGGYVKQFNKLFGNHTGARLEFSIAVGYLRTHFRHYLPTDTYSLLVRDKYNTGIVSYVGPTKVKVSLVIPFFANTNRK